MNRTDIINALIQKFDFESYLEIGLQNGINFKKVVCKKKISIDPEPEYHADHVMTSDDYFDQCEEEFDIVFIDGLHHAEQVASDILYSFTVAKAKIIVLHDCNPPDEAHQIVPREQQKWTGDVWKAWAGLIYWNTKGFCVDTDYGVGVAWKRRNKNLQEFVTFWDKSEPLTYQDLEKSRAGILNLKSVEWFENWVKK